MDQDPASVNDIAVLGSVGRKRVSFGLSDARGMLRPETIRSYDAGATTGVSAALTSFQRDLKLPLLPSRAAIAVSGLARGESISITNTRWIVSRTGLRAMTGGAPLILNDFAAEAWAICNATVSPTETFGAAPAPRLDRPGRYMVIGITSGLAVSVVERNEAGAVTVLATEAGHGIFAAATEELAHLACEMFPGRHPVIAEHIISAPGLSAIYAVSAQQNGIAACAKTSEEITRTVASDASAQMACDLLAKAFWAQVGSFTMTFGAWDGVLVTGALANAIRPCLRRPEAQALFATSGKHQRVLQGVPRVFVTRENAALIGAAEALRHEQGRAIGELS